MSLLSVEEYAARYNMTAEQVEKMCEDGYISEARKTESGWEIQENATMTNTTKKARKKKEPAKKKTEETVPDVIACPACGKGHILKGKKAYGCSAYAEGCRFIIPFEECPADATHADLYKYIQTKYSK